MRTYFRDVPLVVFAIIFCGVSLHSQSKRIRKSDNPYEAQYELSAGIPTTERRPDYLSLTQVFGVENATNATGTRVDRGSILWKTAWPGDGKPPPPKTWLLDPASFRPEGRGVIPRIINKIFFQKGSGFLPLENQPTGLVNAHKSWTEMNPGYTVRYWDLDLARRYLGRHMHPVFLRAFDCLPAFAIKSDLFRMVLLYREGGWHSDWKQECLVKYALQNMSDATDFFAAWDGNIVSGDFFPHHCVWNAFVGARPRHPIITKALRMILANVQESRYTKTVLDTTGPCLLGRAVKEYEELEGEHNSTNFNEIAGRHLWEEPLGAQMRWGDKVIIAHKCKECGGQDQNWGDTGNSYITLYKNRKFYCEDASSLFLTTDKF